MKKSTWKFWIRFTACVCVVVMCLEIVLPAMSFVNYHNAYADSTDTTEWYATTTPIRVTTDSIKLHLSDYNMSDRIIHKERLNDTGVKILYDDGSWLYLHEYMNSENDYNIGFINDEKVLDAKHIVGFEVAPGYEAVIRDGTSLKNGEEHKTRILGPLRLLGRSEEEYLSSESYKDEKDGKKGSARDEKGEYELSPEQFQNAATNKGGFSYKIAGWEQFNKLWEYNWSDILSKEHKTKEDMEKDVRNDVKIFNIKSIMVKRTNLKEGVYLMRGMFNVLNGETEKDMEDNFSRGIFEYISPTVDEEDLKVMYYADETKTNGSVNGIMVVGNYEVNIERKRSKAIIGKESEQAKEYLVIKGGKNKITTITDAWRLNYGYRGMDDGRPTYSTSLAKGMLNAIGSVFEESSPLIGLITGKIKTNNIGQVIGDIITSGSIVGFVKGLFKSIRKLSETREVKPYYNDFVNLTITKRADGDEETDYDSCVYFKSEDQKYAFTRKGESDRDKYKDMKEKEGIFQIKMYDNYVKFSDIPEVTEEAAVTAYTKRDFKGQYFRFYRGETNNVGSDKEIEVIKSLEIAPNTKVIFSDREDCYHESEPNYGSIERSNITSNALVVEGPAYISDLNKYLDSCYIDKGNLKTHSMELKSFRVQYVKNTDKGFSIYKEQDGVGTFENIETVLNDLKSKFGTVNKSVESLDLLVRLGIISKDSTSGIRKTVKDLENSIVSFLGINSIDEIDAANVDNLVGKKLNLLNYYPQSISIRGNYFVKLYDKNDNLSRTIVGPTQNYNLRLDEENENKERSYSNSYNENRLFQDNNPVDASKLETINNLYESSKPDSLVAKVMDNYKIRSFDKGFDVKDYIITVDGENYTIHGDVFGVELERIILAGGSYDELTTKALDYLKEFCEANKGTDSDNMSDRNISSTPTKEQSIRIISRAFLDFYKKKSNTFRGNEVLGKYLNTILKDLYDNKDYQALREKYNADKVNASNTMKSQTSYENDIKNMYTKWKDMKIVINELTQRDKKSRSLENVDGVILYIAKNYNEALGGPEDVWTRIPKTELIDISSGESNGDIKLSRESGLKMEVEYDNINSIKITGDITGSYQLVIKEEGGIEKKTRYSIPNLKEFFGKSDNDTLKIVSIRLDKVADTKELEILLDTSSKKGTSIKVSDFKVINTTETRVKKETESVKEESDTIEREVYMISLYDVLKDIEASMEYLYKYDVTGNVDDELVGVKITRNIGDLGTNVPFKAGDNKQTYKNIDKDIDKIVREVEIKFNKMSVEDIFRDLEFIVSNEYDYTDESRGLIITDHGYLNDEDQEIKVDNAVVTRYYKDVLEVPPMFVKEEYREVLKDNEQVLENGKPKKVVYIREVKEYDINEENWIGEEQAEENGKKFLYVPVCYKEDGKVCTSYLFEQLGINASVDNDGIKLQY